LAQQHRAEGASTEFDGHGADEHDEHEDPANDAAVRMTSLPPPGVAERLNG
jgi:hypothetical protein